MAISQGLTRGFQGVWSEGFGLSTCFAVGAATAWAGTAGCDSGKGLSSEFFGAFILTFQLAYSRGSVPMLIDFDVLLSRFGWTAPGFMDSARVGQEFPDDRF
jgi:hypothetical protein